MDIDQIRSMLRRQGEEFLRLADKLTEEGRRGLTPDEAKMVRIAMLPAVQESMDMIQFSFLQGHTFRMEEERTRLMSLLEVGQH